MYRGIEIVPLIAILGCPDRQSGARDTNGDQSADFAEAEQSCGGIDLCGERHHHKPHLFQNPCMLLAYSALPAGGQGSCTGEAGKPGFRQKKR